jgi:hypothetical protein
LEGGFDEELGFLVWCGFCFFLGISRVCSSSPLSGAFRFGGAAGLEADSALIWACSFFQFDESPAMMAYCLVDVAKGCIMCGVSCCRV